MTSKEIGLTRCFVAIDLPRNVIQEIEKIQKIIKGKQFFDGKLIDGENLHLTLKFLGGIDENKLEEVKNRLKDIEFEELEIHLGKIGTFSSEHNGHIRVLWIGVRGNVFDLKKKIEDVLKDLFVSEQKFMAHITLARLKRVYDKKGFLDYLEKLKAPNIKFRIDRFYLKKSELLEAGPIYEDIWEYNSLKEKI